MEGEGGGGIVYLKQFPLEWAPRHRPCLPHGHCLMRRCWTWSHRGGHREGAPSTRGRGTGWSPGLRAQTCDSDPVYIYSHHSTPFSQPTIPLTPLPLIPLSLSSSLPHLLTIHSPTLSPPLPSPPSLPFPPSIPPSPSHHPLTHPLPSLPPSSLPHLLTIHSPTLSPPLPSPPSLPFPPSIPPSLPFLPSPLPPSPSSPLSSP